MVCLSRSAFPGYRPRGSCTSPLPEPHLDILQIPAIDDPISGDPALARHGHAIGYILKPLGAMRVGVDADQQAAPMGLTQMAPIEVKTMRIGIQFDYHAEAYRLGDDAIDV